MALADLLRPYPQFGDITITDNNGYSWYHALQVRAEKRLSKGWTLNAAYTWSRSMGATGYLNDSDATLYRGLNQYDRPQRIVISGIYELPFGHGRAFAANLPRALDLAVGGWQLNSSLTIQSGPPLSFGDVIFYGSSHNQIALLSSARSVSQWFDTSLFERASGKQRQYDIRTISLNAYSFSKLLNNYNKHREGDGISLMQLLDFCAKNNFDGFDPTGYFFPGYPEVPTDEYVNNFKRRAFELGLGISGTGVRNNFTTSDKSVRDASVQHIKQWVEVAARLGAPVLRVFADTQRKNMTWHDVAKDCTREQVQQWIIDDLSQCAEQGKKFGVIIGVQNHGDFLQTGEQLLSLIKAVDS